MMIWILIGALAMAGLLFCGMLYWIGWGDKGDRVVIFIEGGNVQDVVTSRPTEVLVIDLDIASTGDDCFNIPDEDRRGYPIEMASIPDPEYIRKVWTASQIELSVERTCRNCGCTEDRACEGDCPQCGRPTDPRRRLFEQTIKNVGGGRV